MELLTLFFSFLFTSPFCVLTWRGPRTKETKENILEIMKLQKVIISGFIWSQTSSFALLHISTLHRMLVYFYTCSVLRQKDYALGEENDFRLPYNYHPALTSSFLQFLIVCYSCMQIKEAGTCIVCRISKRIVKRCRRVFKIGN